MGNLGGECSCSISYDPASVYNRKIVKARKEHGCCECGDMIIKGERYEHVKACYDGSWSDFKTCLPCMNIGLSMGCRMHGGLVEMFWEMFGWDYRRDQSEWEDEEDE